VAAYGSPEDEAAETRFLAPSTLYGHAKQYCENWLLGLQSDDFICTITRSASVCGSSPTMRWDVTVNKMIHDGLKGSIKVNGGSQFRCHVHIQDLCDFYELLLEAPEEKVRGEVFNVVETNEAIRDTAEAVGKIIGCPVIYGPATDDRSYMVSGNKARSILGWKPKRSYTEAITEVVNDSRNG
jgi:nucleoside-diphosphate-sugar epimerase